MHAVSFSSFGGPEVLELADVAIPRPGEGQIRIAVIACGLTPFDIKRRRGQFGGTPPICTGVEVAGIVDAVGGGVEDVAIGDRVYGFSEGGGAADFAVSEAYAPIPAGVDPVVAAGMVSAVETAYRVLDVLGVVAGETLLVNGATGVVGQATVQIAIDRGARVIGTGRPGNRGLIEGLGAAGVSFGPGLFERVAGSDLGPVSAAIDAGGGGVLAELVSLTGDPQRVVTIVPDEVAGALGVRISGGNSAFYGLREVAELIGLGRFRPADTVSYPLSAAAAAHRRLEAGDLGGAKLVLVTDGVGHGYR